MDLLNLLNSGMIVKLLPILVIINICLSCLSLMLGKLKDAGALKDSPLLQLLGKVSGFLQKAVDFLSANQKH